MKADRDCFAARRARSQFPDTRRSNGEQQELRVAHRMARQTSTDVDRVRLEMLERGFSFVDTPCFLDDDLFHRLRRSKTVLPFHSKRWWKYPQLARYGCWLERLLGEGLPEESVSLAALEFRHEPDGSTDQEVDRLHADGSYIRSV